jgi:trk system potassium uptake protein
LADMFRLRRNRPAFSPVSVVVIGLGRFGTALARTLADTGHDVLAIDTSAVRVAEMRDLVTHAVEADGTDLVVLQQLGVQDFDRAVVAIGSDIEASILATGALVDLGSNEIWAKAMTDPHARILERVGAHHVVFPERQMGERVAHVVAGRLLEFVELDRGFALAEMEAPLAVQGVSLAEVGARARYGITVVCVKPHGGSFNYATADTVLGPGDVIVVAGETAAAERFAALDDK